MQPETILALLSTLEQMVDDREIAVNELPERVRVWIGVIKTVVENEKKVDDHRRARSATVEDGPSQKFQE